MQTASELPHSIGRPFRSAVPTRNDPFGCSFPWTYLQPLYLCHFYSCFDPPPAKDDIHNSLSSTSQDLVRKYALSLSSDSTSDSQLWRALTRPETLHEGSMEISLSTVLSPLPQRHWEKQSSRARLSHRIIPALSSLTVRLTAHHAALDPLLSSVSSNFSGSTVFRSSNQSNRRRPLPGRSFCSTPSSSHRLIEAQ